jgi:hypothetical protein
MVKSSSLLFQPVSNQLGAGPALVIPVSTMAAVEHFAFSEKYLFYSFFEESLITRSRHNPIQNSQYSVHSTARWGFEKPVFIHRYIEPEILYQQSDYCSIPEWGQLAPSQEGIRSDKCYHDGSQFSIGAEIRNQSQSSEIKSQ